jgi:hypothetical protein
MQYYGYIQVNKKNLFGGMPLIPATNVVAILVEFCMQGKVQFSIELVRIFSPIWWHYKIGDLHGIFFVALLQIHEFRVPS